MKLASHNSWSYLKPKKWWMRMLSFTARCQDADIKTQYEKYKVRCFDLRVKFRNDNTVVVHGSIEYSINPIELLKHLTWLDNKKDVAIRVLLDVRNKKDYTEYQIESFKNFCKNIVDNYRNIKFWCGRNLYNWEIDYKFEYNPSCDEKYSSVCNPKTIDDWCPRLFAKINNKDIIDWGTECEYLMIDFVNYR